MTLPMRSKLLAFVLNFIPGLGHLYWGKRGRAFIYALLFFGSLFGAAGLLVLSGEDKLLLLGVLFAFFMGCISMVDLIVVLLREPSRFPRQTGYPQAEYAYGQASGPMPWQHHTGGDSQTWGESGYNPEQDPFVSGQEGGLSSSLPPMYAQPAASGTENERFFTILLSLIPGLGHFHLGLMQRGMSFLVSFFGLGTMLLFVAVLTREESVLLFMCALPVLWLYCMFDAVQLVNRRMAGEQINDRTLFDQLEQGRGTGRRSKVFAMILSAFPGAGHMYLGLQKRGLQLMALFLGSIYVLDLLRLTLFLFLIPVIWFYSFFDGMQQASRYDLGLAQDVPVFRMNRVSQRMLGLVLLALGLYYILIRFVVPYLDTHFPDLQLYYTIDMYLNTVMISILLIGGGLWLLKRSGKNEY
ncbi:hypothetical protein Q5741_01160 [Paenibacillus sp. JX-17]|uniref:Multi-tm2 domain protein n=1 Tax=Paenibacillus lacisoli TaxID=3064525 RepID=A0ABT9C8U6_9BACL|nr:hypothetical protein [Paenibacillus sp. JX-17]MDO7905018.1 hypothetical protein [Paenibacillus sp. JX-17]